MRNILYFAGKSSAQLGVVVTSMPAIPLAEERGEWETVSGRSGDVHIADGDLVLESIDLPVQIWVPPAADIAALSKWLRGSGQMRMEGWPWFWDARVYGVVTLLPAAFNDGWTAAITFRCQPHRYLYPAAADIVLTAGGTVVNPGTAASEPRISVEATGDFILYVNGTAIEAGASVIIDSRLRDCLETDGVALANGRVIMADFPVLSPGPNAVSWTGAVTKVTITPRWRDV